MQCTQCSHEFSASGNKAAPGAFFGIGLLFLALAALGFLLPSFGVEVFMGWPVAGVLVALFCLSQVPLAISDNRTYGQAEPVIFCSKCETPNRIRPWSL
jgi:hypothetical protein